MNSGEVEKLVTNLPDEFSSEDLKSLYSKRWGIETNFDNMKNKQLFEIFTGETKTAVMQDFYATVLITNLARFAQRDQQNIIDEGDQDRNLMYSYQPNVGKIIFDIKETVIKLVLTKNRITESFYGMKLYSTIKRHAVAAKPGRSFPRIFIENGHRKCTL